MGGSADAVRALVEAPLTSAGLELWDVEVTRDTIRVLVDRPGGIDLDTLATLAGQIVSPLLDEHPELTPDDQYSLEVSSPGVERTLRTLDHYRRYVGEQVSVKTAIPIDGARRHQGVLQSAGEDAITLTATGSAEGQITIAMRDIDRARTVLVWGPAPKPGGKKASTSSTKAVKRPAATGRVPAGNPVASKEKDTE